MSTDVSAQKGSARVAVQRFGTFLSNMVMPNIGAFIAWGLITAIFIKVGWINVLSPQPEDGWVAALGGWGAFDGKGIVGPTITYLLPILIGYTGGKNVYGTRGGVVGAIATMGVITGTSIPMFMGAMIMGPLGGWTMKKLDALWEHKIRPGFEMLVNNFSAGIWAGILAIFGFFFMSPIVTAISNAAGAAVGFLVNTGLLPLTSILIEPAKVLFLNNAINHGILTPLGTQQVAEVGKSVLFLLEANPGPGLGLLLAYMFFGKGAAKASAPGAAIIHFFGGIHEIYFPYVLMKPILILAMIAGGMTGVFINVLFGVGLRAPAAPGSVFAVYIQTATDSYLGVTLAIVGSAAVTMVVASLLLGFGRNKGGEDDLAAATAEMEALKGKKSSVSGLLTGAAAAAGPIHSIVFACDAGMGSSAMGASVLRKKIQAAGFDDVTVVNKAIANLGDDFDVVVSHQDLIDRAKQRTPSAVHVSVDNFMASPKYDDVVELVRESHEVTGAAVPAAVAAAPARAVAPEPSAPVPPAAAASAPQRLAEAPSGEEDAGEGVLKLSSIVLSGTATDQRSAIDEAGALLVSAGAVEDGYVMSMHDRERSVSTYMGNYLAIPHGTNEAKGMIRTSAISVVRYPSGIDWNGNPVKFVIGIAGANDEHLELLSKIAEVFLDADAVKALESAGTAEEIADTFKKVNT
ncbi:PTS system mannitol-specific EIICBA component [Propionicimonas sp. T2.31MG-18]|uniref:PTS mannitol transporter subunit IICBA n=1 Tax=Propionicimonas sp. T2.31MG-18 TaxID=3157620 RepID=UPI0035EEBCD6